MPCSFTIAAVKRKSCNLLFTLNKKQSKTVALSVMANGRKIPSILYIKMQVLPMRAHLSNGSK